MIQMDIKKCLACKTVMEEGFIANLGQNWAKGKPMGTKISEMISGGKYVSYYRCPKCGLIQPYTK